MRVNGHARAALGALLTATTLLAAGCSSSGSAPGPYLATNSATAATTRPAPGPSSPSSSSTFHSTGDPINDAYVQFWAGLLDAQTLGEPDYPPMTQHASGQALAWAQETIRAYVTYGWVREIKPGYGIHSTVTTRSGDTAKVADVQDWGLWPLEIRSSGQAGAAATARRQCITAGLSRQNGTWMVTTIVFAQSGC